MPFEEIQTPIQIQIQIKFIPGHHSAMPFEVALNFGHCSTPSMDTILQFFLIEFDLGVNSGSE